MTNAMTDAQIEAKIIDMVGDGLGIKDISKVVPEASFMEDLRADSLDTMELVFALEEELGTEIPDEKAQSFKTVGDVIEFAKAVAKETEKS